MIKCDGTTNQRNTKGSSRLQRLWRRKLFPVKDKTLCEEESPRSGKNIPAVSYGPQIKQYLYLTSVPLRWKGPAADLLSRSGSSIQPRVAVQAARAALIPCTEHVMSWSCLCCPERVKQGADICLCRQSSLVQLKWLVLSHPCNLQGKGIRPAPQICSPQITYLTHFLKLSN